MLRAACIALALVAQAAQAQEAPPAGEDSAILTVVPDRLLMETRAGATLNARYEAATRALVAENRSIELALEAEERELTARRAVTDPAEFQRIAAEFDTKVDAIRDHQDNKSRDLARARDADGQALYDALKPVLAQIMQESGAVAILDRGTVFVSFDLIDVTDRAIAEIDTQLGDGEEVFDNRPAP